MITLEQQKKERIERLGYDPDAKAAFQPKAKQKGRSSTASLVKRKKKVMDQEHRVCQLGATCQPAPLQPWALAASLCSQPPLTVPPFPSRFVPRTKSGRALSSSSRRKCKTCPSLLEPGHLHWIDLYDEPETAVSS